MKKIIYKGYIQLAEKNEAYDVLFVSKNLGHVTEDPFASIIEYDIIRYGNYVTVKYFISEKEKEIEDLNENLIKTIIGDISADYSDRYSEYTGYLWTDEELNIGGHDLIEELKSNLGKYLYLEISFSRNNPN